MAATIPQEELRNQVSEVLRRVQAGETVTITVAGREVAELTPIRKRRWVNGPALDRVWHGPTPRGLEDDLALIDGSVLDPSGGDWRQQSHNAAASRGDVGSTWRSQRRQTLSRYHY
jgi:prevent-host-death family protein